MKRPQIELLRELANSDNPTHTWISVDNETVKKLGLFESDLASMHNLGYFNRDRMDNKERDYKYAINIKGLEKIDSIDNSNTIKILSFVMTIATIVILLLTYLMAIAQYKQYPRLMMGIVIGTSVIIGPLLGYLIKNHRYFRLR